MFYMYLWLCRADLLAITALCLEATKGNTAARELIWEQLRAPRNCCNVTRALHCIVALYTGYKQQDPHRCAAFLQDVRRRLKVVGIKIPSKVTAISWKKRCVVAGAASPSMWP
jgi:hypothetical protein